MGSITGEKISGIFPSFVVAQQLCIINFCYNIIIWKISFKLIIKSLLSVFVSSHTNFYSQECESRNVTFPCLVQLYKQIFSQTLFISRNLDCMFPPLSIPISKGRNPIIFSCLPLHIQLILFLCVLVGHLNIFIYATPTLFSYCPFQTLNPQKRIIALNSFWTLVTWN